MFVSSNRKSLRRIALFVAVSYVGSLCGPVLASGATAAPVDKVAAMSQKALSDLWFVWSNHLGSFQGAAAKPTAGYAAQFFQGQGASAAQIDVLVNNAKSAGHLNVGVPTAAQAASGFMDRLKSLFQKKGAETMAASAVAKGEPLPVASAASETAAAKAAGTQAAPAQATSLTAKVKSFFSRFTGGSSTSSSAMPASGGGGGQTMGPGLTVGPNGLVAPPVSTDPGLLGSLAGKVSNVAAKTSNAVKNVADQVALGARRGAHAVGSTVKTGVLTAKYAIDPRPYFEIPLHGDTVMKVRGTHSSTVYFKDGKWVNADFQYKSTWPTKADLAAGVDQVAAQPKATGFFGKIVDKVKGLADNVKARMRGEAHITPETRAEIQRLDISNNLIDQARTISDAQRALKVRIDQMKHTSESLRRPLDTDAVKSMEQQYRALEKTKQDLLNKANGVTESPATSVIKDAAKWALYSVGITASINLIRQAFSGEGIDVGAAFSFLTQPSFWGGTAGGFLGSTLVTALASSFMPPGVGIFFKVLPGFLGAALGFDFGSSLFGGQMDLLGTLVTTLASAGGYSLAFTMLGGAAAPGIALIGAAIAAGSLAGFLLDKFRGDPESEGYVLPEGPAAQGTETSTPAVAEVKPAASMSPAATANLAAAQAQVDQSYNAYINYLKQRKIPEATTAHKAYMDAQKALELAKANAAAGR